MTFRAPQPRARRRCYKPAPAEPNTPPSVAETQYTAVLTHEQRGVVSFKFTAPTDRVALAEVTRRMGPLGAGWRAAIYEGRRVVATRKPRDGRWQRPATARAPDAPAPDAPAARTPTVPPTIHFPESPIATLEAEVRQLRERMALLKGENLRLEELHAQLQAEHAGERDRHRRAADARSRELATADALLTDLALQWARATEPRRS